MQGRRPYTRHKDSCGTSQPVISVGLPPNVSVGKWIMDSCCNLSPKVSIGGRNDQSKSRGAPLVIPARLVLECLSRGAGNRIGRIIAVGGECFRRAPPIDTGGRRSP